MSVEGIASGIATRLTRVGRARGHRASVARTDRPWRAAPLVAPRPGRAALVHVDDTHPGGRADAAGSGAAHGTARPGGRRPLGRLRRRHGPHRRQARPLRRDGRRRARSRRPSSPTAPAAPSATSREWLNAQAAGGYVEYHPVSGTYELTPGAALVLADPESPCSCRRAWTCRRRCSSTRGQAIEASAPARASPGASTTRRSTSGVAAFYRNALPREHRRASGSRRSTASRSAQAGARGRRRRLRPRPLDDR